LKEYVLFFNGIPDKPMDDAAAKAVAKELLNMGSNHEVAKRIANS
jgi:hypothetical protein